MASPCARGDKYGSWSGIPNFRAANNINTIVAIALCQINRKDSNCLIHFKYLELLVPQQTLPSVVQITWLWTTLDTNFAPETEQTQEFMPIGMQMLTLKFGGWHLNSTLCWTVDHVWLRLPESLVIANEGWGFRLYENNPEGEFACTSLMTTTRNLDTATTRLALSTHITNHSMHNLYAQPKPSVT